ncbi:protease complex subunit PrcB family protein [Calidithermus chliarophilus]|uniref:protease complex subunit PrcB family protein n=1 Tax=Calidithermus chliarophilus TaxID=52023 RepID=UPI000420A5C7|nr:protease complex subunit PrcB family protein [Calidithermus chliarophilus]
MKRLLALPLLLLGLSACVFEPQRPYYNVTDVQMLFPDSSERWLYFYGDSMLVVGEQRSLSLEPKPEGQNNIWEVKEALWVNKEPVLREVSPRWNRTVARTVSTIPSGNLVVQADQEIKSAWYYDGSRWYQLSASVGVNRQIVAQPEARTPDLDGLTSAEEQVVLREVLARRGNRPVVLYEITPPLPRLRLEPGPFLYRQAGLVVQYGVPQEIVVNPEPARVEVLGQGSQSNYSDTSPLAYLATTPISYSRFRNLLPDAPNFAFNDASLAALFIGQKPTGGYSVRFVSARQQGSTWEITVSLTSPAPGSIVTQVITSPYLLLQIPGKPSKVVFRDTSGRVIAEGTALVQ